MGDLLKVDITVFIQFINTIIALLVINFVLLRPIRAQIKKRKDLTDGITAEINAFNEQAKTKLTSYEHALADTRTAAAKEREEMRAEAMRREADMIAEAHKNSHDFLDSFRTRMAQEAQDAADSLRAQAPRFAELAIDKLLK